MKVENMTKISRSKGGKWAQRYNFCYNLDIVCLIEQLHAHLFLLVMFFFIKVLALQCNSQITYCVATRWAIHCSCLENFG